VKFWIDLETRGSVPIKHGVAKYATDVQVIQAHWAVDDLPVISENLLRLDWPSDALLHAARDADEIWAHGDFDRQILETCGWWHSLRIPLANWRCTMAMARMHGLPGGLDKLSTIFKLSEADGKSARGKALIQIFCIPKKDGTYNDDRSHPVEWQEFMDYGGQDVHTMRIVWAKTPKWNATPRMWALWHLDQKMNDRGVAMDLKLCAGAVAATTRAKKRFADTTEEMTLGMVEATTQRNRLLQYMADFGVDLPDLKADTVERRLEDESLPEHIKELLRIRQQASKASTAKYKRVLTQHVDGRLRNLLVFCGASRTGRWAGRTIQPQNLPRPKHKQWQIDQAIDLFRHDAIELVYPDEVMGLASSCLRGMIISEDGRKLSVADLANIEGRKMAWVAHEDWKLAAFGAYDRKEGPDLYKLAYARSFNINAAEIEDDDWRRQIGKVMELALQYYGGVGAFCSMAETYGLRLEELAVAAWPVLPKQVKLEAQTLWVKAQKRHRTYGLDERIWVVCMALVLLWRAAHPAIVSFWYKLDNAVKAAIRVPNKLFEVGRVGVDRRGAWLRIRLPVGRYLLYPAPRVDFDGGQPSFVGVNPYTKQWGRISTYSGKLTENIVQGSSADILMDGLLAAEDAGYNPVLSVHDEVITEPPDEEQYNDHELSRLMISNSPWAAGMPLAAKGFTSYRYRK
jgi:DNA polymerase